MLAHRVATIREGDRLLALNFGVPNLADKELSSEEINHILEQQQHQHLVMITLREREEV